jgi:hypothetical protein
MSSYEFGRQNICTQTSIYSYSFGIIYNSMCVGMFKQGKSFFKKKNMYSYSLSKHMYHHIYFGSYVIVILKVKTEEKRTKG